MGVLATLSDAACYATGQLWSQILELCDARGFSPTLAASIVNNLQVLTVREDLSDQGRMSAIFTSNSRQVLPYTEKELDSLRAVFDKSARERTSITKNRLKGRALRQNSSLFDDQIERLESANGKLLAAVTRNRKRCGLVGALLNPEGAAYTLYSTSWSGIELEEGVELPQAPGEEGNSTVFYLSPGFGEFLLMR